ncbi:hypothetical protein INT47_006383 [Mucor saturninus]|uniref:Secreted protein n=1 Tax=Mucor saturninus TaxID=64648 RepID=A0A8H7RIN3_9FUNG|nr:hypothetical protein INT47_006383 [Mucor saturninus]
MVAIQSLIFTSIALLSTVSAYGQIAQVVDANNFCVFLPPSDSVDRGIADTEWNAQAFCIGKTPKATNAGKLNSGFIQSAHYLATDKYVQVTGKINPAKARLNATDEGGQYDIKAPKGSSCAGWKFYVNLVEPAGNTYCMRCCNDDRSCNRGISEKGCAHIIPGDYSGPDIKPEKTTTTKKIATTTTTKKITTTTTIKKTTTVTKQASATTTAKAIPIGTDKDAAPTGTNTIQQAEETITPPTTTTRTRIIPTINEDADSATPTDNAEMQTGINVSPPVTTTTAEPPLGTGVAPAAGAVPAAGAAPAPAAVAAAADGNVAAGSTPITNAATADSSNSGNKVDMLSQNELASAQSVDSGAIQFQPSMIAFAFVAVAMMLQ